MAKMSGELINMLTEFLIHEIGSKSVDGITYAMITKDKKDEATYKKYVEIRKEATKCGYSNDDIFRIYEVANGYIFDMDLNMAKKIAYELTKAVNKTNGGQTPVKDFIADNPEKRRKADMLGLAKYVKAEFDNGAQVLEVALFSRNSTPRIMITGIGTKNEMIARTAS